MEIQLEGEVEESVIEEAAQIVASRMVALAEGEYRNRDTWLNVAQDLGIVCREFHAPGGERGFYVPEVRGLDGAPLIFYNTAYPDLEISEVLIHEIGHDRLHQWNPPLLSGEPPADMRRYNDDPENVSQRVVKRVERIILYER